MEAMAARARARTAALSAGARIRQNTTRGQAIQARRVRRVVRQNRRGSMSRNNVAMKRKLVRRRMRLRPSLNIPYSIERLQGVRQELPTRDPESTTGVLPGYYTIGQGDPVPAGVVLAPLYMVDLTVVNQGGLGDVINNSAIRRMTVSDTGEPAFVVQSGQLPNGVDATTYQWQNENRVSADGEIPSTLFPRVQHNWYDIRLKLYGCRRQAVKYQVSLVRFQKREYCPEEPRIAGTTEDAQFRAFYQSMVKPLVTNSILPGKVRQSSFGVRILKTATINLPASSSDDLEAIPENTDVRWFVRDGRILNHKEGSQFLGSDQTVFGVNWATNDTAIANGQITVRPPHWSRTYLMIRATDMTRPVVNDDMDDTPSFDLCVRRKSHYYN